ncbi:unnamed protein product [Trichogramma brassicae]|uniref:Uncharacterized protein n=1 Tax=Trichogramma brassicae TaxID=86971 RepID=A0A6H5HUU8_9HYME|nr:unnamed protein product [Trichogramma brassicae]
MDDEDGKCMPDCCKYQELANYSMWETGLDCHDGPSEVVELMRQIIAEQRRWDTQIRRPMITEMREQWLLLTKLQKAHDKLVGGVSDDSDNEEECKRSGQNEAGRLRPVQCDGALPKAKRLKTAETAANQEPDYDDYVNAVTESCVNLIVHHISNMSPRTVTILFGSDIDNTKENLILKLISCQGITYVSSIVVEYFEKSSIFVILIRDESEAYSVKKYIDDFTDAFPNETRPKILVVLLEGEIKNDDTIRRIYEHGWTNKFLDVSLVKIGHSSSCVVQVYNPFESRVGEKNLNDKSVELFPDKLINVHQQKITMGAISNDPLVKIVQNSVGEVMYLDSADTDKTILAFESMNFNIEYVIMNETVRYYKGLLMFVDELRINQLNLVAFSRGFPSAFDNVTHVYSGASCYSVAAAVPYWINTRMRLPWQTLTYLFVVPSFIGLVTWMLKVVNALNDSVRILDIFGSLFGVTIGMKPTKITEMIVLSTIFFVSIVFPSDFYSHFINEKLVKGSVGLNTFKSIDESGLDVFCMTAYSQTLLEINDTWAKNIHQRLTPTYDQNECMTDLMSGNPRRKRETY